MLSARCRASAAADTESTRHRHDANADDHVSCGVDLPPCSCRAWSCAYRNGRLSVRSEVRSGVPECSGAFHPGAPGSVEQAAPTAPATSPAPQAFSARGVGDGQTTKTKCSEEQRA